MDDAPTFDAQRLLEHAGWARALARRLVLDEQRADDLVQQAWLAALERPPRDATRERSWLGRVIRNVAWKERRAETRRALREQAAARPEPQPAAATLVAELAAQRLVVDALVHLEEPYRETLVRRWYRDEKPAAIARAMSVPVKTVETRLARGLERLRAELTALRGGDRRGWALALVPLAARAPAGVVAAVGAIASELAAGAAVMSGAMKLASAAALIVAAAAVVWVARGSATSATSPGGAPPAAASAIAVSRSVASGATVDAARSSDRSAPETDGMGPGDASPAAAAESLHVHCVDAAGMPITGASAVLFRGERVLGRALVADGGGDLPIPESDAELVVDHRLAAPYRTSVAAGTRRLEVTLPRAAVLSGIALAPARRRGEPLELRFWADEPFAAFRDLPRPVAAAIGGTDVLRADVDAPVDDEGRFEVCGLAPSTRGHLVAPDGFSFEPIRRLADGSFAVEQTREVERPGAGLQLELHALPALTGRLFEFDGAPARMHEVATNAISATGGFSRRDPVCRANGLFRVPLDTTGIRSVVLEFQSEMLGEYLKLELEPPLDEGRELGDLHLALPRSLFLHVTDLSRKPIESWVAGTPAEDGWTRALWLKDGSCAVAAGIDEVLVGAFGFAPKTIAIGEGSEGLGSIDHPIEVTLEPTTELRVRVRASDGSIPPSVAVELRGPPGLLRGDPLAALARNELLGGTAAGCASDESGEWVIRLEPGEDGDVRIADLEPAVPFRVVVVDVLGARRFDQELTLAPREKRELAATLRERARTLHGRLVDDAGAAVRGAFVTADTGADHASATSDDDGAFAIAGLFVDRVRLHVSLAGFETLDVARVDVAQDDAVATFTLRRSWPLTVVLVDATGARIDDAEVEARRRDAPAGGAAAQGVASERWIAGLRGRGLHRFDDLPSSPMVVTVLYAGRRFETPAEPPAPELRVEVPQTGRATIRYDLPIPEAAARGKVLDSIELVPTGGSGARVAIGARIFDPPRRAGELEAPSVLPGTYSLVLRWRRADEDPPDDQFEREPTGATITITAGATSDLKIAR